MCFFDTRLTDDPCAFVFNALVEHYTTDDERLFQRRARQAVRMSGIESTMDRVAAALVYFPASTAKECLFDGYRRAVQEGRVSIGEVSNLHSALMSVRGSWEVNKMFSG
ncbi:hypothetical protein OWT26_29125 [Burkholderia sp. 1A5]